MSELIRSLPERLEKVGPDIGLTAGIGGAIVGLVAVADRIGVDRAVIDCLGDDYLGLGCAVESAYGALVQLVTREPVSTPIDFGD